MDKIVKLFKEKAAALNSKQTTTIFILLIVASVSILLLSFIRNNTSQASINRIENTNAKQIVLLEKMNNNLSTLNKNLELQNKNSLTVDEAAYVLRKTFISSKCLIATKLMLTISRNNIDDSIRQDVIYKVYRIFISNLYTSDYSALSKFKYKSIRLSEVLDDIDNKTVTDGVTQILFNKCTTHKQIRLDLVAYLDNTFNQFYQQSLQKLSNTYE